MISWALKNWKLLAVLGLLIAISAYGAYKEYSGRQSEKLNAKVEKLEDQNKAQRNDIETRKQQNEILVRDITPSELDGILLHGAF